MHPRKVTVERDPCLARATVESCTHDVRSTAVFWVAQPWDAKLHIALQRARTVCCRAPRPHATRTPARTRLDIRSAEFVARPCWHLPITASAAAEARAPSHATLNHGVLCTERRCLWVGDAVLSVSRLKWTTKRVQYEGQNVRRKC